MPVNYGSEDFAKILDRFLDDIPSQEVAATNQINNEELLYLQRNSEQAFRNEKVKTLTHYNTTLVENSAMRKVFASNIFILTCIWSMVIFLIIIAEGLSSLTHFYISDNVLIALITSTTINFFGFFLLVVKYLFNIAPAPKSSSKKLPKN